MKTIILGGSLLIFSLVSTAGLAQSHAQTQTKPQGGSVVGSRKGTSQGPGMNKPLTKGQPYRGSSKNGSATDAGLNSNAPKGDDSRVKGKTKPGGQNQN